MKIKRKQSNILLFCTSFYRHGLESPRLIRVGGHEAISLLSAELRARCAASAATNCAGSGSI